MNILHPSISKGIIQSISKLKEDHKFEDFKVKVGRDIYSCHSFILASCSEFFRRFLRTDLKEKQEMEVELKNISSPIFKLILNSLYTGCELLTKENVIEVWSAVHQLQIPFLIEHCEDFVVANVSLNTLVIYKQQAERVESERICNHIFDFMCTHFKDFRKTETMLELNCQELLSIIKSNKLKVSSEDEVLFAIFDWASYGDILTSKSIVKDCSDDTTSPLSKTLLEIQNDSSTYCTQITSLTTEIELTETEFHKVDSSARKTELLQLLKATRYCLASESCIIKLYEKKLTRNDTTIKDILFEALSFKSSVNRHGFWPTSAIHRDCSDFRHVGVLCDRFTIRALDFQENKWFSIPNLPLTFGVFFAPFTLGSDITLWVFNRNLYFYISHKSIINHSFISSSIKMYKLVEGRWMVVAEDLNNTLINLFTSNNKYIYCFTSTEMIRFNPNNAPLKSERFGHNITNPQYALSFINTVIVFSSVVNHGVEETAVHSWNTETHAWTKLNNFEFSAKNMTSFHEDRDTYILDSNGNLWKLTNSELITFTFVAKLWIVKCDIKGAVLFRETLYLVLDSPIDIERVEKVPGVFNLVSVCKEKNIRSNFIHWVIAKDELKPLPF